MSDAVAEALRELDRDAYFASLFVPGDKRDAVQALWAFGAEIAAAPGRVSEPMPGEIRLQWWTDALEGAARDQAEQNPVAAAVLRAIADYDLPTGPLVRLIAARRFDLYQDPMPDMATFEGYAGETVSILFQYTAAVLAGGSMPETGDAAGHLGVARALAGHVRAFGFNAARGRIFLPISVFKGHGVPESQIFAGTTSPGLAAALTEFVDAADGHRHHARDAIGLIEKRVRPAFAAFALLSGDIKGARRTCAHPFRVARPMAGWQRLGAMWLWALGNG